MGTICAPSYENIFLWLILKENKYTHQVRTSLFFTYDIFMISLWYGKEHTANYKKRNHEISKEEVAFLDPKIHIDDKKKYPNPNYRKETDQQGFLHSKSEHTLSLHYCTIFKLLFFSELNSFRVLLFAMMRYIFFTLPFLHVAFSLCCTFFVLHSLNVSLFLSLFMFSSCFFSFYSFFSCSIHVSLFSCCTFFV